MFGRKVCLSGFREVGRMWVRKHRNNILAGGLIQKKDFSNTGERIPGLERGNRRTT